MWSDIFDLYMFLKRAKIIYKLKNSAGKAKTIWLLIKILKKQKVLLTIFNGPSCQEEIN